jgi:hypothetical protein
MGHEDLKNSGDKYLDHADHFVPGSGESRVAKDEETTARLRPFWALSAKRNNCSKRMRGVMNKFSRQCPPLGTILTAAHDEVIETQKPKN